MRDDEQINGSNQVIWAHEFQLFVFGQIAKVEHSELAVGNQGPQRARVFGNVGFRLGLVGAGRIRVPCAWQGILNVLARGSEHHNVNASYRNVIAGFHNQVLVPSQDLLVRSVVLFRVIGVLKIPSVINKCSDFKALGELRHAADVITMKVRD